MSRITILDPTAPPPDVDADPGPSLSATDAARFGIRYDLTWRSFEWVRDEWATMLVEDGAEVSDWCAGDRTGEAADATLGELRGYVGDREVLISGLGN